MKITITAIAESINEKMFFVFPAIMADFEEAKAVELGFVWLRKMIAVKFKFERI